MGGELTTEIFRESRQEDFVRRLNELCKARCSHCMCGADTESVPSRCADFGGSGAGDLARKKDCPPATALEAGRAQVEAANGCEIPAVLVRS